MARRPPCCCGRAPIGEVVGVTHLHDKPLPPLAGTPFDDVPHMLLTDYLLHWVDITRTLAGRQRRLTRSRPSDSRVPGQPDEARNPWSATLSMTTRRGRHRDPADRRAASSSTEPGCPFWVHGTTGTLRGSVLLGSDRLELDDGTPPDPRARCPAPGSSTGSPRPWAS